MPATRGFTASLSAVSDMADAALADPEGLDIDFTLADHGSPEACAFAARSFQKTFTSLRARQRKLVANEKARSIIPATQDALAPYDRLACVRQPLEDGSWVVSLIPNAQITFKARSRSTGAPLNDGDPKWLKLIDKLVYHRPDFTQADWDALTVCDAENLGHQPDFIPWHIREKQPREAFSRTVTSHSAPLEHAPNDDLPPASSRMFDASLGRPTTPEEEGYGDFTNS